MFRHGDIYFIYLHNIFFRSIIMRIIGLDVGEKRIGVALSDELGWTAQAHSVINRSDLGEDLAKIVKICRDNQVTKVVVGLPKNMDGSIGKKALEVQEFGQVLEEATALPLVYSDERLSTVSAERVLIQADLSRRKRKKVVDKIAAVHILQLYLDSQNT